MTRRKVYECPEAGCGKVYVSFQSIKQHRITHGGPKYTCTFKGCGKYFKWRSSLASHKRAHSTVSEGKELRQTPLIANNQVGLELSELSSCINSPTGTERSEGSDILQTTEWKTPGSPASSVSSAEPVLESTYGTRPTLKTSTLRRGEPDNLLFLFTCDQLSPHCLWDL
mmetsp:Transcript_5569/g.16620  ORF Transcript_5569/g.16620 Transcript_5569/m.16620 type:complete len:169 (+) Transcript_5569:184-690(+)